MQGAKDGAIGVAMKNMLNDRLSEYGTISACSINTKENSIQITAMLKGEKEAVIASVEHYELTEEDGENYIVLRRFSSSREWLTSMLSKFFTDKRYKVPSAVSKFL